MRWGEGPNTTPTLPRHDSSLPIHGQTSQPYLPTRGIRMPEENRWAETSEGAQSYNSGQEINDPSWGDEHTQRGVQKEILTETHDTQCTLPRMINDFFGQDVIGPSYINSESQPFTYNLESSSQYGFQTPPPMHESQTQEHEGQYGRGLREHRPPDRLSPSGRRARPAGRRRIG
ncbi:uncharacterized protein LOC123427460 isoform X2 [Hordeum vulgare subsp. vulgare]|uniref:uncharacterized protein LOC123427460 isoform X2 n=1 Tax=Hordeum vulgare subsp. vulgare TaxID=112509 RepID=UPI001D1A3450|nr:uncharacterized protein LOC123427460 isoform X2 [Hordeum vulgare subsp. vulgare]